MIEVVALLKTLFGSGTAVYSDVIPEGTTKPAVTITEISNSSSRVLSGKKYGLSSVWRVTLQVSDIVDMAPRLALLESLDNTKNSNFQKIFTQYVLTESRQPGQILTRAFYDLTLYK